MKKFIGSALLLPFIMIGCGGGNSTTVGTGYYVDSAVEGVSYVCGNQNGITNAQGRFTFEIGKGCSFLVNDHAFKTVAASDLSDGVTIQERDTNIARFLLSLDDDGIVDEGIKILPDAAKVVDKIPKSDQDFAVLGALLANVSGYSGKVVSEKEAQDHLNDSIAIIVAKATVSSLRPKQGDMVTFSATSSTISRGEITSYEWMENGTRISTQESFSKSDFTLGAHTLTLVVRDRLGGEASDTVSFTVVPATAPTKWDDISPLATNGTSELFVTSDADNIYLLLKKDTNITDAQFFLNTDDSNISGVKSGLWPHERFDYIVKSDGVFHLLNEEDYTGVKVQEITYTEVNNTLEVAIDKTNIEYLAQSFGVSVFFPQDHSQNIPTAGTLHKFTDTFYDANQQDSVPPVIFMANNEHPVEINVGGSFVEPGVSAQDVISGVTNVVTDSSGVDTSKAGFYTVLYTATDTAGNVARASRVVKVLGAAPQSTLEKKELGVLNESVIINHQTGLVWADDNTDEPVGGGATRGCLIMDSAANAEELRSRFQGYCERSDYAGFTDWRVPTPLELSKYTVQMFQEGKTPGMARKGCTRTLGVESDGTVKAVWTHNMNQPGRIDESNLTPSGGRCVRGDVDTTTGGFALQELTAEKDKVIVDTTTNLMWVNESNKSKKACLAIHFNIPSEYTESQNFCATLDHAGFTDWRDPTPDELSNFVIKTTQAHLLPGYEAPCKRVLARSSDGNESAIATRFETNSSLPLGTISPLEQNLTSNIGLRCVRPN